MLLSHRLTVRLLHVDHARVPGLRMAGRVRRRRTKRPPTAPFTEAEDAKVVEITQIGLSSDLWHLALPERTFGEIVERRLQLRERGLCSEKPTD